MTSQPTTQQASQPTFEGYLETMDEGGTPLLGHLVLYSIFDGTVTRDDLEKWFRELGLDLQFVPPALRPVDAFERVTGPDGSRVTYPLDGSPVRRRRKGDPPRRQATLMVRHVTRDQDRIVRHVVREVRDERQSKLSYVAKLGEVTFERDKASTAEAGAGTLRVKAWHDAIKKLPEVEQAHVHKLLEDLEYGYTRRCTYLTGDKIRGVIRNYIESLNAVRVRSTGGVYFTYREHAEVLAKLRELVARCGNGSHLVRVPLPDSDEQREMVVSAWRSKAAEDLQKLAREIANVTAAGKPNPQDPEGTSAAPSKATVQALHRRFTELQDATSEHEQLLSASLDDTHEALRLVNLQLASLLTRVTE